ncbi:MAG: DUF1549 domain-containing protein, partial [Planctomycetaceae bacterium]|nr:DUF1549 domain-containing protein [Planctomycetaceae bacterium]
MQESSTERQRRAWNVAAIQSAVAGIAVALTFFGSQPVTYGQQPATAMQTQLEHFEKQIRPLLAEQCFECHSVNAKKIEAGLLLDSRSGWLKGGDSGPAMVPGHADKSLAIEAIRYESFEMPPRGKMAADQIQLLTNWVNDGAPWPDEPEPVADTHRPEFDLQQRKSEHWVWQPIRDAPVPAVRDTAWIQDPLDAFLLADLETADLHPAAAADRTTLARRLYFDLIGLPPSPEEMQTFLTDESPQAIAHLVDRLLASPHFGERWGRHWL